MRREYVNAGPAATCGANVMTACCGCGYVGSRNHDEYLQALRLPACGRLDRRSRSLK